MVTFRLEAIVPKQKDAAKIFKAAYEGALRAEAESIKKDFDATMTTWEHKARFFIRTTSRKNYLSMTIYTKDAVYAYVNYGTKPHVIRPKKARVLRFQSGYSAKTRPGFIGSSPGGSSGDTIFAQEVHHPGTAPRGFDKAIAEKHERSFKARMDAAMAKAARQANS